VPPSFGIIVSENALSCNEKPFVAFIVASMQRKFQIKQKISPDVAAATSGFVMFVYHLTIT